MFRVLLGGRERWHTWTYPSLFLLNTQSHLLPSLSLNRHMVVRFHWVQLLWFHSACPMEKIGHLGSPFYCPSLKKHTWQNSFSFQNWLQESVLDFLCCLLAWQFTFTNQGREAASEGSTLLLTNQCLFELKKERLAGMCPQDLNLIVWIYFDAVDSTMIIGQKCYWTLSLWEEFCLWNVKMQVMNGTNWRTVFLKNTY